MKKINFINWRLFVTCFCLIGAIFAVVYKIILVQVEDSLFLQNEGKKRYIKYKEIKSEQKFKNPPSRYSESTIIKKLEKLGIGRPSTYAYVIGVVINRKYVKVGNTVGEKVDVINYKLSKDKITKVNSKFKYSSEYKKFIPTDIGKEVCNFLVKHFNTIMDINFTADMENKLNLITNGDNNYVEVIDKYYKNIKNRMDNI